MFPDTPSHLLDLVSRALDEFESVPISATVRRALRIARLRGDVREAYRFALELGVQDVADAGESRTPSDPESSWRGDAYAAFCEARTSHVDPRNLGISRAGPILFDQPLDELDVPDAPYEDELALVSRIEKHNRRIVTEGILAGVRNLSFRYLIACETELRLAVTGESLFSRHRARVDGALRRVAPDVLDKLNAAIRRASESDDPEARAQALTSCRRVLTAVADLVFPAREEPYIDSQGNSRQVGSGNYRNRIVAALEQAGQGTFPRALRASIDDFASRLDRLDELTQKGVHGEVTVVEMEFGIVQTYLLAGEILVFSQAP